MALLDQPLGHLARNIPGATGIFHEYQLDFCCGGQHSLREAAQARGIDAGPIAERLEALNAAVTPDQVVDWTTVSPSMLIDHIVERFHDRHREQLPELIRLARRVEHVHGDREDCPVGLADLLDGMQQELESHMQKEEQILFPMLSRGHGSRAGGPIAVMRMEHDQHGDALQQLMTLTNDITLPRGACTTWRALYLGLRAFREDLMEHIHLENNVLFEGAAGAG
ncbi:iron-sulfur cluster repair protein YtfE [Ralstonia pickettii]|jgi:regulator of cell morphogenesis and NO signaling|uniref:Hemerythrin-like domain-containing protein n=3 Tax=Ralstonia TaxID=48736 RepID=C6BL80_RALP1|nr:MULTISPECIES: iron-sulfur cluster repair protein YtfE [Ralstonia]MDE2203596.1 iron-sulfur cluster repair protein YtfE [Burkholderiaceae bacterium]MBA9883157.1 iron-sulfur cluster repair protein YtfE [Ralstonia pickettii]MBA9892933.1 iron-sulfur cluster repair protein YtfE [Ralstonia pickettii]MBA9925052.1 iron-sulfur cluster repair protein YtfE [Ralstonia pickettii]MBB0093555.1 iron-sulfur cluster repair protein YtfE [Ralstonia pickettii]